MKFCAIIGRPELATDARFVTNALRVQNRSLLIPLIAAQIARRPASEWLSKLTHAGVPCGPVNTIAQAFSHPQVAARDMLIEVSHPAIGALKMAGSPLKLAGLTNPPRRPPPLLGEHTDQVLAEVLQLTPVEIGELRKRGVV